MKRIDRIYQQVVTISQQLTAADVAQGAGATTKQLVADLGIVRPNVSKALNDLVRTGKLTKLVGRPVRYLTPELAQQQPVATVAKVAPQPQPVAIAPTQTDFFDKMIGAQGSLKNQVEQAKAAMLYPPKGLNTLIIGPTGSGKTFFVHGMYQFSSVHKIIDDQKPLITFNCADYAHNPELLMSHLFGYTKGAFTGANEDKDGLIQEAEGGMLFLDEVHRLPPEGQEMIFYFMDHGTYSRLGETAKTHHANVRLVCATTENPESSLLETFVRRIPITIQLPSFNQRPAKERLQLLQSLFSLEVNRIHKQVQLSEDVVKALLGSVTYGNVGQLKSNIQLVCAQGFLRHIQSDESIMITAEDLPATIQSGIATLASNREELSEVTKLLEPVMVIGPEQTSATLQQDAYELPYNLYEIIGDKAAILKSEGLDQDHINNFITTDINLHLKSFYRESAIDEQADNKLAEIVDQDIIDLTKEIQGKVQQLLGYTFKRNFVYAVSLHISSFVKRIQSGKLVRNISEDLKGMVADYQKELEAAYVIKQELEAHYNVPIPKSEVYYLTILLASLRSTQVAGKVGVVVAAHGSSTASSMVQVVNKLLSADNLLAYDMPIEMSPTVAYQGIVERVRQADNGNGVILLVDMGSLSTFSERILKETGITVKTIDMVTTAMVLEAVRKTELIDNDLDIIYHELKEFHGYSKVNVETLPSVKALAIEPEKQQLPRAVVAICSTGEGTAVRIQKMIEQQLAEQLIDDVTVIPISVVKMKQTLYQLSQEYHIIATTGIVKPDLQVPFVALDRLLQDDGHDFFEQVIAEIDNEELQAGTPNLTKELCESYMKDYFLYLNPHKLIDVLWNYSETLSDTLKITFTETFRIGLILHIAGALERTLLRQTVTAPLSERNTITQSPYYHAIQVSNAILKDQLKLALDDDEIYYVEQLFDTQAQKNVS
ncbi:sigma-54-dependent transcriptional regulator [Loigolactobacillus jiayinensis]|uniref:Sigma 54-interacting transcriptional regulator n=1 Tax=Loigolactobacillus jiayinensis TaxID=2486016 RepID=A0ABW1R8Z6_9LACO|nr:sigma-54-dependent transcriptional regulator [Loigolactobacillus jiayinensis]